MDELLDKMIKISGLSEEEIDKFKNSFYEALQIRVLQVLEVNDHHLADNLMSVLTNEVVDEARLNSTLEEISKNKDLEDQIKKTTEELFTELIETIKESATEDQKQQLLASL